MKRVFQKNAASRWGDALFGLLISETFAILLPDELAKSREFVTVSIYPSAGDTRMATIACLHATRSSIEVFEETLRTLDYDGIQLLHRVESELLAGAVEGREVTPAVAASIQQIIAEMCQHADAVIVTCSTLGEVVWDEKQFSKPVLRVDASLAKVASRYHGSILVLCTADASMAMTTRLFSTFIPAERLCVELVPRAWAWLNNNDITEYHREIARYIQQRPESPLGCIVLAQISMAGAEKYINSTLAVLTGPSVSLQMAIEAVY